MKFAQIQPSTKPIDSELGRIFFYRPSSFGAAIRPDVLLNGEKVGEAISWGYFYVDRPPGDYQVVTNTEVTRKLSFILEEGQTRYIKFSTSFGFIMGHVYGKLVDQETGFSEIQKCKYTGGEKVIEQISDTWQKGLAFAHVSAAKKR
jgi:hypothetical protein